MSGQYDYLIQRRDALMSTTRMPAAARARIMGRPSYPGAIYYTPPVKPLQVAEIPIAPRSPRQRVARVGIQEILEAVAAEWKVNIRPLLGSSKAPCFARPRFAAALLMKERLLMSTIRISSTFGRESGASGWDMAKRARQLLATDPAWAALYRAAEHALDQKP